MRREAPHLVLRVQAPIFVESEVLKQPGLVGEGKGTHPLMMHPFLYYPQGSLGERIGIPHAILPQRRLSGHLN